MSPTTAEKIAESIFFCGLYSYIPLFFIGVFGCIKHKWLKGRWAWFLTFLFFLALPTVYVIGYVFPDEMLLSALAPYLPFVAVLLLSAIMKRLGRPYSKGDIAGIFCFCGFFFTLFFIYWSGVWYTYMQSLTP